jgi:hypothetical protein
VDAVARATLPPDAPNRTTTARLERLVHVIAVHGLHARALGPRVVEIDTSHLDETYALDRQVAEDLTNRVSRSIGEAPLALLALALAGVPVVALAVVVHLSILTEDLLAEEEPLFRGIVLRAFMGRWSFWPSAALNATVFGLAHAPGASTVSGGIELGLLMTAFGLFQCRLVNWTTRSGHARTRCYQRPSHGRRSRLRSRDPEYDITILPGSRANEGDPTQATPTRRDALVGELNQLPAECAITDAATEP